MNKIVLGSMLIMTSLFAVGNTASANSVQNEINRTNRLIGEYEQFERNVVNPEAQKYQRYLNSLYSACINGNMRACNEHNIRIREQNQRLDRAIEIIRNRNRRRN